MKPKVLVCRATFDEVIELLRRRFEVEDNQEHDTPWSADEMRRRIADKDGVIPSGTDRIDGAVVDAAPRLRAVCNGAAGYNNLDIPALTGRGILATNTPGVLAETTADMAWALMTAAARRIVEADRWVRAGSWKMAWRYDLFAGMDLYGATLGIVGMGSIGQAVARRARGFGMRVLYHNRKRVPAAAERELRAGRVTLARLLRESDFVSVHVPYSPESHHLIGAKEIALMKPTAILVNTARGGVVDDAALVEALRGRRIAAAALDVFQGEPKLDPGFLPLDNVTLTPHIGSSSRRTRLAMAMLSARNLIAALDGRRPPNLLNPEAWAARRRPQAGA